MGNWIKTTLLLAAMSALVLWVARALGGPNALLGAGIFVGLMNLVSFWFSDRIVLAMHRARLIDRNELPWLHDIVDRIAERAGFPGTPKLYFIDTPTPNAFATGRSPKHAAVAVTRGLLDLMDRRELEGVLAHELSHVKHRDTLTMTVAATLAGVISWVAQMAFFWGGSIFGGGRNDRDEGSGLGALGVLLVAPLTATLLQLAVSRSREYGADQEGARLTGDPRGLASALSKLERGNRLMPYDQSPATAHLFIVNPLSGRGVMTLFSTHPPIEERISRLLELPLQRGAITNS
jgi:heat shock protein HtpX